MKRILLLEDDKKTARALSIRLRAAGYDVWIEHDGCQGVKAALTYQPDLVLTDIWMPGQAGFQVAERLKAQGLEHVPFIVMTASRKPSLWRRSQDAGAAAFLEKPYAPETLLAAIDRALRSAASGERRAEAAEGRPLDADLEMPPPVSGASVDPAHS